MGVDIEKRPRQYEAGADVDVHQRDGSEGYTPPLVVADKLSRKLTARQVQMVRGPEKIEDLYQLTQKFR